MNQDQMPPNANISREERFKQYQDIFNKLADFNKALESLCPKQETLEELMRGKPTSEVEGFYYWGSPRGKEIAKAELKRRRIDKRNFFQKLFNL